MADYRDALTMGQGAGSRSPRESKAFEQDVDDLADLLGGVSVEAGSSSSRKPEEGGNAPDIGVSETPERKVKLRLNGPKLSKEEEMMRKIQKIEAMRKESEAEKKKEEEGERILQEALEKLAEAQAKLAAADPSKPFEATEDAGDEPGVVAAGPSKPFEATEDAGDEDGEGDIDPGDDESPLSTPPESPKDPTELPTIAEELQAASAAEAPYPFTAPAPPPQTPAHPPSAPPSYAGPPPPAHRPAIVSSIGDQSWNNGQVPALAVGGSRVPPREVISFDRTTWAQTVNTVLYWAYENPARWGNILCVYFQTGERSPREVSGEWIWASALSGFERHWRMLDWRKANRQTLTPYAISAGDKEQNHVFQCSQYEPTLFEEAVSRWARDPSNYTVGRDILWATFWWDKWGPNNTDWQIMHHIFKMPEGPEKAAKISQAEIESPLFFAACLEDALCGSSIDTVIRTSADGQEIEEIYETRQRPTGPSRILWRKNILGKRRDIDNKDFNIPSKRHKVDNEDTMNTYSANGRPTQFHAVPPEERAYDENGNQLPWALEWPDDHPNARGQKRRPVETGPFGKSGPRKGSRRTTRTATPAKKESSAADGYSRALEEDKRRAALYGEDRDSIVSGTALQQDNAAAATNKEPVQVMLYGFSEATQWAAVSWYEKVSGGMICEDYDRHPPPEARRIPSAYSSPGMARRRALTPLEKRLSMSYKGGKAWIRVTFDSAEAAERAYTSGPHVIQGHWVHAEKYADGVVPNNDEPIPYKPEDRELSLATSSHPSHVPSHWTTQSLGPAFTRNVQTRQSLTTATLPRSFTSNTTTQAGSSQHLEAGAESPSTASSATATAPTTATGQDSITLRRRVSEAQGQSDLATTTSVVRGNAQYMRHFPDVPRTALRPASEAFLPQPTLTQKALKYLEDLGLIPGDVIGHMVPRTESGEFDWPNANFYWRFFFWMDTTFGTDMCGLRDD